MKEKRKLINRVTLHHMPLLEQQYEYGPPPPQFELVPSVPDTHTAQFYDELYKSLQVRVTSILPPDHEAYDVNDEPTVRVSVKNTYEHSDASYQLIKRVPKVVFMNVNVEFSDTRHSNILRKPIDEIYDDLFRPWDKRLEPGDEYITERVVQITGEDHTWYDPLESLATIKVTADLDLKEFFKFTKKMDAYVQVDPQ